MTGLFGHSRKTGRTNTALMDFVSMELVDSSQSGVTALVAKMCKACAFGDSNVVVHDMGNFLAADWKYY